APTRSAPSPPIDHPTNPTREASIPTEASIGSSPASTLAPSDVDIPLRLNVTPDKVGFIRVHDIQPAAAQ
ncbi:DUF3251 domain-containing protein, partial [Mycobacterium tuberculosis]|nr:DUF3251 domain-containing protein [Mycobacterium tuberculosis]